MTEIIQEKEVVKAAQQGNREAQAKLVKEYSPRIYNLALRIMRNEEDAEDVLQESFIIMLNKLHTFSGRSSFYTWLYRVATNVALGKLRERKHLDKHVSIDEPEFENMKGYQLHHWPDHMEKEFNQEQFQKCLTQAMKELPDNYRTVFVLRDLENLSTADTANILGISEGNVKVRLMRARLYLRDQLAHEIKCLEVI